jgi:hypothetical protein
MKSLLLLAITVLGTCTLQAQDVPSSLDVMQGFVRNVADTLRVIAGPDADTVRMRVHDHPDALWFESIIMQRCDEQRVPMRIATANDQAVTLVISDASTSYQPHTHPDSLVREVVLDASMRRNNNVYKLQKQTRQDVVAHEQAAAKQSDQHASTKAVVPEKQPSLWDDVLQPIVFIGAAVVTLVLLFTVRSQ